MASYNPLNNQNGYAYMNSAVENKGLFSRILRNISTWGMNYDDMVLRNQVGVNINEDPYSQQGSSMYDFFSKRAVASVLNRKSIPYLDRSYSDKRRILREYSVKDEIRDYVSVLCDEAIIFRDRKFCRPRNLSNDFPQEIRDKYLEYFERIYNRFGFSDSITAWGLMKDFLIDGYIAMEIVWDDKKKNIIHLNRLRPETLVPAYDPAIGHLWIQFPDDPQLRRIFLDSQMVFISYSAQNDYSETSYVEGLIKPFNQLKILEQAKIMFNIVNATLHQVFTIPTNGLSRQRAEEQIGQLIHDYSEQVEWDDSLGTLQINGSKHLNYWKQIWFPAGDGGTPTMELRSPQGANLNEDDMLKWFHRNLKRASKIPLQRFADDSGGGNLIVDSSSITHDEINYHNFVGRLQANFKELILKPLKMQLLVEFPEIKDDERLLNQIDIEFSTNQFVENLERQAMIEKKAGLVSTLSSIQKTDGTPYFHLDYLMDKVWELSAEDKEENQRYWLKDTTANAGGGTEGGNEGADLGMGGGEPPVDTTPTAEPAGGGEETPPPAEDNGEFEF